MKAVNLIPVEERRGPSAARSGNAVYLVLGGLAVVVIAIVAVVLTDNTVKNRRGQLAESRIKASAASAEASALKPYSDFATMKDKRVETVTSLAKSRFDWQRVMRQLAQATPRSAWLSSMTGTVAPGVNLEGATTSAIRGARTSPAVELVGCARSQGDVARMMTRMRLIRGVTRVSLDSSQKSDATASSVASAAPSGESGGGSSASCGQGDKHPLFQIVLFFENTTVAPPSGTGATAATPATGQSGSGSSGSGSSGSGSSGSSGSGTSSTSNATAAGGGK